MKRIIWITDAQKDFINPGGGLYVPGAELIKPNIRRVLLASQDYGIDIFGSVDAHEPNDKEFEIYNPHCVIDTEGQGLINECKISHPDNVYYIPNTGNGIDMNVFEGAQQIYFEKQTTDVWDNCLGQPDNIQTIMRMLDVTDVYVIGVATNICVISAVKGFTIRDYNVHLITDAVKGLTIPENDVYPETEDEAIETMEKNGVRLIKTSEVVKELKSMVNH